MLRIDVSSLQFSMNGRDACMQPGTISRVNLQALALGCQRVLVRPVQFAAGMLFKLASAYYPTDARHLYAFFSGLPYRHKLVSVLQ